MIELPRQPLAIELAKQFGYNSVVEAIDGMMGDGVKQCRIAEKFETSPTTIGRYKTANRTLIKENHDTHSTEHEISFMKKMHMSGKFDTYYQGMTMRDNWDGIDKEKIMAVAGKLLEKK